MLALPLAALAATPAPHASAHAAAGKLPGRIDLTKVQPKALLPKKAEHTEFVVEVNRLGQVAKIRSQRESDNSTFNIQTYGNATQTFIRTPDGHVVVGVYRLTYDFDPKTARVRRDVSLLSQGGVNPDAKGAAIVLLEQAQQRATAPRPAPSVDPRNLPDLKSISAPAPSSSPH